MKGVCQQNMNVHYGIIDVKQMNVLYNVLFHCLEFVLIKIVCMSAFSVGNLLNFENEFNVTNLSY